MIKYKKFLNQLVVIITVAVLSGGSSFYAGFTIGKNQKETVYLTGVSGNINPPEDTKVGADFDLFWQAWNTVKKDFIDVDNINDKNLLYGAVGGLVNSLKDPYTVFFPPQEAEKFTQDIEGSFGGIGAEIGIRKDQLVIIAPLENTPAAKAGLRGGDAILEINGTSTAGIDIGEAVNIIRGPIGTEVKFLILRKGWDKPKEFKIKRATITVPTLKWELKPGGIAYFHLNSFNSQANRLFYNASLQMLLKGVRGVVLDLRNNPGGFLEVAVDLAGWFLKRGDLVVSERFKSSSDRTFKANGNEAFLNLPMVLLVNEGSASASEILAGAIHDQRNVKLVGEKTFGKGSVQTLKELKDGSTIKITVAKWVLPSGKILEKNGLEPDYKVTLSDEDIEKGRDPQLNKAIEVLQSIIR